LIFFDIFLFGHFLLKDNYLFEKDLNIQAVKCLSRIVVNGQKIIGKSLPIIVNTIVDYIKKLSSNPAYPDFSHYLFEILAATISRAGGDLGYVEGPVFELLSYILENDVTDFIPYVFQIIGTYLLCYPEGTTPSSFYIEKYSYFIQAQLWQPQGNIPALAFLIRSYIIKLPNLIIDSIEQILGICQLVLPMPLSHIHAFYIIIAIFQFMPLEFSNSILPQVMQIIGSQLSNEELSKYRQAYASFMSNAAFILSPDILVSALNPVKDYIRV